ncbi:MAG: hypothetical protein ABJD07_17325, partial [Gemmatimonadaceae bacterium]
RAPSPNLRPATRRPSRRDERGTKGRTAPTNLTLQDIELGVGVDFKPVGRVGESTDIRLSRSVN